MTSTTPLPNPPTTTVLVTGLPTAATDSDVRSFFSSYGHVTHVRIGLLQGKPNGTAQVRFRTPSSPLCTSASMTLMGNTIHTRVLPCPVVSPNPVRVSEGNMNVSQAPTQAAAPFSQEAAVPSATVPVASTSMENNAVAAGSVPQPTTAFGVPTPQAVPTAGASGEPPSAPASDLPPLPDSFCFSDSDSD